MSAVSDYKEYEKVASKLGKRKEQMGLKDGKIFHSAYKFCDYRLPEEYELFKAKDKGRNKS